MINGGQSYRWRQLMQYLERCCNGLLWLALLMVAIDKLVAPITDQSTGVFSVWSLAVVALWSVGLLVYQLGFKSTAHPKLAVARTVYLIFSIIMLGVHIGLRQDISTLTMMALASVAFNSLLYANFGLVFANMIGLETLVLFSGKLIGLTGASYAFKNLMVLTGLVYGATLLILSLYNSDQTVANQAKTAKTKTMTSDGGLATLINNLSSGIIRLDKDFKINLYNASTLAILDTNVTLTGRLIGEVLKLTDLNDQPVDIAKLIQKTTRTRVNDELLYQYQTGEKIRLELTISPIKNVYGVSEAGEYILILRDVTLAKNLEMERDEFVSVISHELRTPIAIAEAGLSNLELMMAKGSDPLLIVNSLKKAHQQLLFLADMTNDLASLARANRGEIIQLQTVDLTKLLQMLFEKYQAEVSAKGLQFDLDLDPKLPKIATQPLYLEEILQNLLTNAIKYTETGSITLTARAKARGIEIAVADTGVGIGKNQRAKVFDKFYRVEDYRTRQTGGTGLGLYVANKLAHKLHAELKLVSRVGFGSTFSLILPKTTKISRTSGTKTSPKA